jgi:imidazolonepropionase-like amidohydrolase
VWVEDNNIDDVLLLLGLVDGHTHPVFAGDRVHEFAMKVRMFLYNGR